MREESARGTRLHVTSAGGKRVSGQRRFSTLLSYFLSELSGKHDLVFTMIFFLSSTTADPTPPTSPAHSAANCTHIQVRSGDAVGPESRAAHPSTLSSRSSDVCNRTNHRRNTHRKVISPQTFLSSPHLLPSHPRSLRDDVAERIRSWKSKYSRFQPQLTIIQAGSRPDSSLYVRMKAKAAEEVGIDFNHITLPESATVEEVVSIVKGLNDDPSVSAILVQLPLGPHVGPDGERTVTEAVSPEKDVDG